MEASHEEVMKLLKGGYTYRKAANKLGIKVNHLKTIVYRNRTHNTSHPSIVTPKKRDPLILGRAKTCQYIEGDPNDKHLEFCGASAQGRSAYCPEHHKLCYIPKRRK